MDRAGRRAFASRQSLARPRPPHVAETQLPNPGESRPSRHLQTRPRARRRRRGPDRTLKNPATTGRFLLFSSLLLLPLVRASAFNDHAPFDISADMVEYVDADQSINAEGHAVVIQGTSTLKADWLRYERETQRFLARGHVFLTDQCTVLLRDT